MDLSEEFRYIQELLLDRSVDNEFRLENRPLPRYVKMEVWKSYLFCDKRLSVDPKDLFLNAKELVDEILVKVIKGVQGSTFLLIQRPRRSGKSSGNSAAMTKSSLSCRKLSYVSSSTGRLFSSVGRMGPILPSSAPTTPTTRSSTSAPTS